MWNRRLIFSQHGWSELCTWELWFLRRGLWPLSFRSVWRCFFRQWSKLPSWLFSLFLLLSWLFLAQVNSVYAQDATPTCTNPECSNQNTPTIAPTWEPLYQTPTPRPTQNSQCLPDGQPITGWLTVTPSAQWGLTCSLCTMGQQIASTPEPYQLYGQCSTWSLENYCQDFQLGGVDYCRCPGSVPDPVIYGTPTPVGTGEPAVTPTVTESFQSPHYYTVVIPRNERSITTTSGPLDAGGVNKTNDYLMPGLNCGGDDIPFAYASTVDIHATGSSDGAYVQHFGYFGPNSLAHYYRSPSFAKGATVDFTGRTCGYDWDGNNIYYCDLMEILSGIPNTVETENVNVGGDDPVNRWYDRWVRVGPGATNTSYDYTVLCYGDEEPMPEPTPTPVVEDLYCGEVEPEAEGGSLSDVGTLPVFTVGPPDCDTIPAFEWDLSWLASIGGLFGLALPASFSFPGMQICLRAISFGELSFLGVVMDLDKLSMVMMGYAAVRAVVRS